MSKPYFLNELADSVSSLNTFSINQLADSIGGVIYGSNDYKPSTGFTGIFETLNEAQEGDIVIRHWINGKGVEIANDKNVACLITLNPKEDALEMAEKLHFPVIVVERIEFANAFALRWTIDNLVPDSKRVVISGTNGKSTSSHLIYHILSNAGYNVFTNTDAKSEFNTLIDPMVAKLISEEVLENQGVNPRLFNFICDIPNKKIFDYLVIEVSEVQGWGTDLMKNHALIMSSAINPDIGVVTNVAMDHIGLVNSIEEVFEEISGVVKATNKGGVVLNFDDENVFAMKDFANPGVDTYFTSMDKVAIEGFEVKNDKKIYFDSEEKAIIYGGKTILKYEELPFTGNHFIRNILSAISACISLDIPIEDIVKGVKSYMPLKRRFTCLYEEPIVIDDFAHNPDGIKATVKAASKLANELNKKELYVACAIRGSRGETLNGFNSKALTEVINELNNENDRKINLILSSSVDLVDHLNFVEDFEKEIFLSNLDNENIKYIHFEKLYDALGFIMEKVDKDDLVLLIGAQGMDPASDVLKDILGY
ncbi:Mur ligase family protein [Methanobrevibacter olleyae]|uniref:Cell wall biosynthesis protein Mur ligase family n=1 Tax=Methanobrevibacter olleyae TaxID=294671 RepID=A0A126QZ92_METOL|nr:Mur ligase family protein [Methanobrevibacter olleyae]AMK15144.1 cell wall biosynthesis protein Mur ligase family [Methanobrevibacter olleyae]SFL46320.1 UDP-N-acetylmuramate--alanine ligase [Methanobrevibacter olleyae]